MLVAVGSAAAATAGTEEHWLSHSAKTCRVLSRRLEGKGNSTCSYSLLVSLGGRLYLLLLLLCWCVLVRVFLEL